MAIRVTFGTIQSDQAVGADAPRDDTPFRIAVLGDFSGRGARGEVGSADDLARRRPRKVDRGNLDDLMSKLKVEVSLPTGPGGLPETIPFRTIDDFHPDGLFSRVDSLRDASGRDERTEALNAVLHAPEFQSLEAAWRGLDALLETASKCQGVEVKLVDLSPEELFADLEGADELEATGLYRVLVDQPAQRGEMDPWSLLVGLYQFEPTAAHAAVLGKLARVARQASAPLLACASPAVLAAKFAPEDDAAEAWSALRALPESALLALAAPRYLVRPPYGEDTRSIDAFEFEEATGKADWPHYLWGNPALPCAALLARTFAKDGWAMKPGTLLDLPGMAMHVARDEDDEPLAVLAEAWLTKPVSERLVDLGLVPLLCVRGRDRMELLGFHSLAQPPKGERTSPLLGRWGQTGVVSLPRSAAAAPAAAAPAEVSAPAPPPVAAAPPTPAASPPTPAASPAPVVEVDDEGEGDPELAALLAELDSPAPAAASEPEPVAAPRASEPEPPPADDDDMDPELAALLADLDKPPAAAEAPAAPPPPPPADDEDDPELAALLAGLSAATPAPASAAAPAPEPADDEDDPELAALLAGLSAATPAPAPAPAPAPEPAPADDVDPELAALLAELDGGNPPTA